jgi:uncharacterized protein YigE (DUF2233 family)
MKKNTLNISLAIGIIFIITSCLLYNEYLPGQVCDFFQNPFHRSPKIVSIKVNPDSVNISFYWKTRGEHIKNISKLKAVLESQNSKLLFATNAGMFDKKLSPIGLFIENGELIKPLNTKVVKSEEKGSVPNFYLEPNGVLYITQEEKAGVCKTTSYSNVSNVKFATQSGPMLVIDGVINKKFHPISHNFYIRNGVGILPNNELIFAISINKVTFYDFARYFKEQGCSNALFLDGYVSKAFIPKHGIEQMDGELGVLIGITEK